MDVKGSTPSLRSQHAPVRPSQGLPFLGRDPLDHSSAIFTIIDSLQQLGLQARTTALLRWLGRFEGLEKHLEDHLDPVLCVRQTLLQHVADRPATEHAAPSCALDKTWHSIVSAIVALPFVHACGDWSCDGLRPRIRWDPLEQAFLEFLAMGLPGEELSIWHPPGGTPCRAKASARLLQRSAR